MSNDGPPPGFGTNFGRLGTIPTPTTERDALAVENARLRAALESVAAHMDDIQAEGGLGRRQREAVALARAALAGGEGE